MLDSHILRNSTLRHCVVFLMQDSTHSKTREIIRKPCATAFVVAVQAEINAYWMTYLVTARHCFELSNKSQPLFARVGTKSGGFNDIEIMFDDWEQHPMTDVCIVPIVFCEDSWVSFIADDLLLKDEEVQASSIKEGHELLYVSLFRQHYGRTKVLPLTRKATIALMPHEKIMLKTGPACHMEVSAYLVETHSWGGHSGAPVFTIYPECINQINLKASPVRLLGILTSHFEINRDIDLPDDIDKELIGGRVFEHSGISAVIPAQAILDLLMDETVKLKRETNAAKLQAHLQQKN